VMMSDFSTVFNSTIETGLRGLILLVAGYPHSYDIERLTYYDYLLVHSGDIADGPDSIHPKTPHRSGEILVRRPLIEKSLNTMLSRGLIEVVYSNEGIHYVASELASPFLDSLQEHYTKKLIEISDWVVSEFDSQPIYKIRNLINKNLSIWGGEFINKSAVRGVTIQ